MSDPQAMIYRFKVTLLDIEPEIWRLIDVPETYTFWDLHVAIQDAMGWLDYHLHQFMTGTIGDPKAVPIGIPESAMDDEYVAGWTVPIAGYFPKPGAVALYEYDFGDAWSHEVRLVAIGPRERGAKYPRCVGGERACPPEDCGGVSGYHRLLEVLAGPQHQEHDDMVRLLKGHAKNYFPYHPDEFEPAAVKFSNPKKRWKMMMDDEA